VQRRVANGPTDLLSFHDPTSVKRIDAELGDGYYGRGSSVENVPDIEYALTLTAQWLSSRFKRRQTFGDLVADPPDIRSDG
jgi:hypothetical protein